MSFTIAIIGRPNVGKSTLFNKLVGKSVAIVDDFPGVTRDRREGSALLGPIEFKAIDTAGLDNELNLKDTEAKMHEQSKIAISDSDLCIFVTDYKTGVTPIDIYFASWLKQNKVPTILIVNKCDNIEGEIFDKEYYRLGLGQAVGISAEHKSGFNLLYDMIEPHYSKYQEDYKELEDDDDDGIIDKDKFLQIGVIGRPNVGKSTFLNKLIGENRLISGPQAGITRDSITINWEFEDYQIRLIDTAGIRKKSNISEKLEQLSLLDSFRAIRYAQILIIIIDVSNPFDHQDLAIANMAIKEGRGVVFAINKFDLIKDREKTLDEIRYKISKSLPELSGSPVIPISALTDNSVLRVIKSVIKVYENWKSHIPTSKLNEWIKIAEANHAPIMVKGKPVKLKYITQAKKRPPTLVLFTNYPKAIKGNYEKYIVNSIKKFFNLESTIVRLIIRKSDNPFKDVKYKKFSKKTKK